MTKQEIIHDMLKASRQAARVLAVATTAQKDAALERIAAALRDRSAEIVAENQKDIAAAAEKGLSAALIDRLTLTPERIEDVARSVEEIVALPDPIGDVFDLKTRPNGLRVGRMRVPLGVIGIVFESRPNVVIDAATLCLKSGNAVVLRGGSEAANSNRVLGAIAAAAVGESGLPAAAVQVIGDTDRELVRHLLQARGLVDLVIPRGGEGLIRFVDQTATVPIILHYKGVCHAFVDKDADLAKALPIVENAKCHRPGVCNALETLLLHRDIVDDFLPLVAERLTTCGVALRGDKPSRVVAPQLDEATAADWDAEYLDLILSVAVVADVDDALAHIAAHGSGHTEAIITENYTTAARFLREADASCIVVNASTRFNDGGQLGLGAEMGISTTKLHAYGPMGLAELTTSKFVVLGSGQVRE
ncbi:MAG: glutamate-5-semialdehyde dehydrogenase [Candidatus Lernaella stagnicola]|nr:glutamate-5-semialdehyde dehydrogenase [Candidatus Lernaella stagnicola]